MKKGRQAFTKQEAEEIRELLRQKVKSGNLKMYRDRLRQKGFFIRDFTNYTLGGFSAEDFDDLIRTGRISLI